MRAQCSNQTRKDGNVGFLNYTYVFKALASILREESGRQNYSSSLCSGDEGGDRSIGALLEAASKSITS